MTEEGNTFLQSEAEAGSPKSQVDNASLKSSMDKNKESLKVKLMLRRPINQLIEQGILPPLKTSPGFYEQKQKLERAKTGDFLKHKIQRRPQRQELIEQHILEDTTVDPSLHEKQRQLKKARLADDLNDRLSHRPGPLELIKGNILHTDESFEQAIKEGQIHFKKTCEGEIIKHPPPRFVFEEESSSDSAASPQLTAPTEQSLSGLISFDGTNEVTPSRTVVTTGSPTSLSYIVSSPVTGILTAPPTVHSILLGNGNTVAIAAPNTTPTVVAVSANTTPIITSAQFGAQQQTQVPNSSQSISNFKDNCSNSKCRKKAKSKAQPKTRTIKFHEYKGPPNAKNNPNPSQAAVETSYELLLQQQQLFLQWQLEWQQKYPQIILPAAQKSNADQSDQGTAAQSGTLNQTQTQVAVRSSLQPKSITFNSTNDASNASSPSNASNGANMPKQTNIVGKIISKLEDMKVSDLKAELKKRNLPVSGAKQQLIDRLKPYTEAIMTNTMYGLTNSAITHCSSSSDSNETKCTNSPVQINSNDASNVETIKTECISDTPMSPSVMDSSSPPHSIACNGAEDNKDKQFAHFNQVMDTSPVSVMMEVDHNEGDQSMDVNKENANESLASNDEIVILQQQKIAELQRELQKSQMQLHMQNTVIPMETQAVTIPITNAPQFHIVSTSASEPLIASVDPSTAKSMQRQLLQQHIQQKMQQNMNARQNINGDTNLTNMLTNATVSPSVKANLAAFLQNQQQHQQQSMATKLLNTQNMPFQQLVICPTLCATSDNIQTGSSTQTSDPEIAKQRTNSLPNGLGHKLLNQRAASLPNFSTLIASPLSSPDQPKHFIVTKSVPPPDYNEATKQMHKSKDKKKTVKSQAVDDVLEILIKNGELPPSAAHDPTTPTTPEKNLSLKNNSNLFLTSNNNQTENAKQTSNQNVSTNDALPVNNSHNADNAPNNESCVNNNADDNNSNNNRNGALDFDFILDLEGLAEAMDMNIAINEKAIRSEKINNHYKNNVHNDSNNNNNTTLYANQVKPSSSGDLSLSEFMDFQECTLEDANWLEIASTSAPNTLNMSYADADNNNQSNANGSYSQTSSAIKNEMSKHDPLLPNTMFGGNAVDPLGDLFFDDSDFKTSIDFNTLMWDKVDFAT